VIETDWLKDYFERARRWEQEELCAAIRSKRLAWAAAAVAAAGMIAAVSAVAALAPLKRVEPFLVRVDKSTGVVDAVSSLADAPELYDEALQRYFIAKYVRARESWSRQTQEWLFEQVSAMSAGPVQKAYAAWIGGGNPSSPQRAYGPDGVVAVTILSVQLVRPDLASVRYAQTAQREQSRTVKRWIATVAYRFLPKAELSIQQRLINPLAFAVIEYRTDPEAVE
jgi:type IV secretion system protein VirB8